MKAINLTNTLKDYNSGWVMIDQKYKVVAWAKNFEKIASKAKKNKSVFIMPASKNYFGFITYSGNV